MGQGGCARWVIILLALNMLVPLIAYPLYDRALKAWWDDRKLVQAGGAATMHPIEDQGLRDMVSRCGEIARHASLESGVESSAETAHASVAGLEKLERSARTVRCLATLDPPAICRPQIRDYLIDAIAAHDKLMEAVRQQSFIDAGGNIVSGRSGYDRDTAIRLKLGLEVPDARMIAKLRELIALGYLAPSDWKGWFSNRISERTAGELEGVTGTGPGCAAAS